MLDVEQPLRKATATLTAAAAGNYGANDVISNSATDTAGLPLTITNIARKHNDVVTIYGITAVCSEDSVLFRARLHFFDTIPAVTAVEMDDNAAFAITTSTGYLGAVLLDAFADMGGVSLAENHTLRRMFACAEGDRNLYVVVETLDAETNETASMTIKFDLYVL